MSSGDGRKGGGVQRSLGRDPNSPSECKILIHEQFCPGLFIGLQVVGVAWLTECCGNFGINIHWFL